MKFRLLIISTFLAGCASTEPQLQVGSADKVNSGLVEFAVEHKPHLISLACAPINEEAAKTVRWVDKCNELAFDYLSARVKEGMDFQRTISKKPFGMAADFTAKMLMSNPSNFTAVSIGQTFKLKTNKT